MFDNTSLDQFSLLDELPSTTPVWRPFVPHAADTMQDAKQDSDSKH